MIKLLREPLLHFLLLGGALFAVDGLVHGSTGDDKHIVIGAEVESEAREAFELARGREPNEDELRAMTAIWLDNEVLYREGLAMQVDKGDTAIRERVIFKALSVIDANVKLPQPDDKTLREWFEAHRSKYDEPTRYDFDEAVKSGDRSEAAMAAFVAALNSGKPGSLEADLRVFKNRPYGNLVQSYGEAFSAALGDKPDTQWRAIASKDGWRAVRLKSVMTEKPADFEALRGVVQQDWRDATAAEQRSTAVRQLAKKYTISFEASPPHGEE